MSMARVSRVIRLLCLIQGVTGINIQPSTWIQGESASVTCIGFSGIVVDKDGVEVATCIIDQPISCAISPVFNNIYTASKTSTNISVHIPSVSRSRDSGVWICQGLDINTTNITIDVKVLPVVHLEPTTSPYKVIQGAQLVLTCTVDEADPSVPSTGYTWSKDGIIITGQSSSIYRIESVERSDSGSYTCTGTNSIGTGRSSTPVQLYVLCTRCIVLNPPVWIQGQPASITCSDSIVVFITRDVQVTSCIIESSVQCNITPDQYNRPSYNYTNYYTVSKSGNNVSVHIANVSKDRDSGYWSCTGSTANSTQNITIDVKVLKAVPSVKIQLASIGKIIVNQTTDIICTAGVSYPHATITWSINGGNNLGSGTTSNNTDGTTTSILQYTADNSDDDKLLLCTAANGYGTSKTDSVRLNIRHAPRQDTRFITTPIVSGNIGDIVQLVANVISYPSPTFTWYYNNITTGDVEPIYNDDVFKQNDTNISINTYRSTLNINITSNIYYTSYTANVSNNIGYTKLEYQVVAQSKPDVPSHLTSSPPSDDSICITWTPGFNGGDQQEFIVQHSVDNKTWTSSTPLLESDYCIKNLQADTSYYIRVIARNKYGDSQPVYLILSDGSSTIPTLPREPRTPTGTNGALIAGIVTSVVIGIIVVAVVVFILIRKRRQGKKKEESSTYDGLHLDTRAATGVEDTSYQGLQQYVNLQSPTTENQINGPLQHRQQTTVDGRDQTTVYDSLDTDSRIQTPVYDGLNAVDGWNTADGRIQTPVYDGLNTADRRTQTPVCDSLTTVDDRTRDHVSVEDDATESYVNVNKGENAAYANLGTQPSK